MGEKLPLGEEEGEGNTPSSNGWISSHGSAAPCMALPWRGSASYREALPLCPDSSGIQGNI